MKTTEACKNYTFVDPVARIVKLFASTPHPFSSNPPHCPPAEHFLSSLIAEFLGHVKLALELTRVSDHTKVIPDSIESSSIDLHDNLTTGAEKNGKEYRL